MKFEDEDEDEDDDQRKILTLSSSHVWEEELQAHQIDISVPTQTAASTSASAPKMKPPTTAAVSKLRTALTVFGKNRSNLQTGLGTRVVGTLFGYRRGHVLLAFQGDPNLNPPFLVELSTPTSILVREMASGMVRIALECEKKTEKKAAAGKLLEEPIWKTFCNGKKCGYALRRECGLEEWKVLKTVGPVSMGAGVLPGSENRGGDGSEGELMYMRAKFERVVGSKDSESFYMVNPEGRGGPELSIFLLRA